jgi:hypothetical protein
MIKEHNEKVTSEVRQFWHRVTQRYCIPIFVHFQILNKLHNEDP